MMLGAAVSVWTSMFEADQTSSSVGYYVDDSDNYYVDDSGNYYIAGDS